MSRNIEIEAWLEKWKEHLPANAIQSFQEITDRLDTIAQTKVGENMKLTTERDVLRDALIITRGQWIHSVHAKKCLAALGKENA